MALRGIRVLELAGLAPSPFCGLILSDFGASVTRIDRVGGSAPDGMSRGKSSIQLDLKAQKGKELLKDLARRADVIIEPFRPGVMERLGVGPDVLMEINPGLVYARLTGFGQTGVYASRAGHDINYIAISGALSMFGRSDGLPPVAPVNILGDFAAGGQLCAMGILLAIIERGTSGLGQVVDSAMVDGAAYLNSQGFNRRNLLYSQPRGKNLLDTGAPFYDTYKTSDDKYIAVGAIESQFFKELVRGLGYADWQELCANQMNYDDWPKTKIRFATTIAKETRAHWESVFDGVDACVTPVLTMDEMIEHPHSKARALVVDNEANAAPKLSRTPANTAGRSTVESGSSTHAVLQDYGISKQRIQQLVREGVVAQTSPIYAKL